MGKKCPEGTIDHRQAVERSGTPANDATNKLNPDGVTESIPERIPLVVLNAVCLKEQSVFLLERPLLVVLLLATDILHRLVDERRADGERAVPLLPCECGVARGELLHPLAAVGLDGADEVGQRHRLRQRREDVHVVGHAADFYGQPADALDDAADVGEDAAEVFRLHLHARALDVEYQVNVDFYQCTCHDVYRGFTPACCLSPRRGCCWVVRSSLQGFRFASPLPVILSGFRPFRCTTQQLLNLQNGMWLCTFFERRLPVTTNYLFGS